MKPIFVVFEGLDGSGTSTQAARLEAAWRASGRACSSTSEPSSGPIGQMIRQALKGRLRFSESPETFDRQLAYLFAADRFDHLYNDLDGVQKLLERGISVVSTRYVASSFAYHCRTDGDWDRIQELNRDFPQPDLLVYLRNPVQVSLRRMQTRPFLDSYESGGKLEAASENYERYLRFYRGKCIAVDATLSPDAVHLQVVEALDAICV